jgi:hypothetical protein
MGVALRRSRPARARADELSNALGAVGARVQGEQCPSFDGTPERDDRVGMLLRHEPRAPAASEDHERRRVRALVVANVVGEAHDFTARVV